MEVKDVQRVCSRAQLAVAVILSVQLTVACPNGLSGTILLVPLPVVHLPPKSSVVPVSAIAQPLLTEVALVQDSWSRPNLEHVVLEIALSMVDYRCGHSGQTLHALPRAVPVRGRTSLEADPAPILGLSSVAKIVRNSSRRQRLDFVGTVLVQLMVALLNGLNGAIHLALSPVAPPPQKGYKGPEPVPIQLPETTERCALVTSLNRPSDHATWDSAPLLF